MDKNPQIFDRLTQESRFAGVQFVRTLDVSRSKSEYYDLLSRAKVVVSTASHENFGIAMVEAAMMGCYPVCPYKLSYPETMEIGCLYQSYSQMVDLVDWALQQRKQYVYPFTGKYWQEGVTDRVCQTLQLLGRGGVYGDYA